VDLGFKVGVVFLVALVISAIATRHHLWILVAGLAMIVAGVVVAAGFVAVALALGDGDAPAGSAFVRPSTTPWLG
jgi:multisubunit Na+/H+ antiporter MnhB subunit